MSSIAPPFGITVCGIEELAGHCEARASHVLSILDPDHPVPEAFGAFGEHQKLELRFHDIIEDRPGQLTPQPDHVAAILQFGRGLQAAPPAQTRLLVHCHAGISRSTASMVLILAQAMPEVDETEIVAMVHGIREKAWPNLRMIEFGDAMLQRSGRLVAAVHVLHGLQLGVRPQIRAFMESEGRQRELDGARETVDRA